MPIFRPTQKRDPLVVAMSGARLGDRLLALVGRDVPAFLDLAARVGMSGRALALAPAGQLAIVEQSALARGLLVETAPISAPLTVDGPFDVVVVDDRSPRAAGLETASIAGALLRGLRPGGRAVVLLPGSAGGLAALLGHKPADPAPVIAALSAAGFTACRLLADREGIAFVEALRAAKP